MNERINYEGEDKQILLIVSALNKAIKENDTIFIEILLTRLNNLKCRIEPTLKQ